MITLKDLDKPFVHINLPSGGKYYKNKCSQVKMFHLCAEDLSILLDRTLIASGDMLDVLLKNKVTKSDALDVMIPTEQMTVGDRNALLIQLRIHLNPIYRVSAVDPDNGREFQADFNLTSLKTVDVVDEGDENGHFTYVFNSSYKQDGSYIPVSAKFRLMTGLDEKMLRSYERSGRKESEYLLLKLILTTISIDGNEDRAFIEAFIKQASMDDIIAFSKYTSEVMPSIDYNITVTSAEGKSVDTFLRFTPSFFLP